MRHTDEQIRAAHAEYRGNCTHAAHSLGLTPTRYIGKARALGLPIAAWGTRDRSAPQTERRLSVPRERRGDRTMKASLADPAWRRIASPLWAFLRGSDSGRTHDALQEWNASTGRLGPFKLVQALAYLELRGLARTTGERCEAHAERGPSRAPLVRWHAIGDRGPETES